MFSQEPNRIAPKGGPSAYITYEIRALPDTRVVAACKDVGCGAWLRGWETICDENTDLGRAQAHFIRHESGRDFTEMRTALDESGLTVFRFKPFQRCFAEHKTKPDLWLRRDGDWRGNPTGRQQRHVRALDWVEDFQEHEGHLADLRQKG